MDQHSPAPADPLAPLFAPLTSLRGIGPATAKLMARVCGGERVLDLLFLLPDGYVDRRARTPLAQAEAGALVTAEVEVVRHERPQRPGQPWRVVVADGTAFAELVFFRPGRETAMLPGTRIVVSGKVDRFADRVRWAHPDRLTSVEAAAALPGIEPTWPLTAGLWPRQVLSAMAQALRLLPDLPEWADAPLIRREGFPPSADALRAIQAPSSLPVDPLLRRRLGYDELLAGQIALARVRGKVRARTGRSLLGDGALRAQALARFGHAPTPEQARTLREIDSDLAAPRRMLRLLQGDVGSGKTLVAILAMLRAVEAGTQAALMAPTEVLARQHFSTLSRLCPVPVALLTGSVKGAERHRILLGLADGSVKIVVGTHALFQEAVDYRDLGLAVIDEQHRFGVEQRVRLGDKGALADVLVMTATPIPRTLLLTQWGEMDVSVLSGKPAGRKPIRTTLHSLSMWDDVLGAVARKLDEGALIYWVCPLVAESEALDVAAAEDRVVTLRLALPRHAARITIAHGQQDAATRATALEAFARGDARLLVATTIIEVGVDVPEASVMVIDHAERFGLAQLHQLRGRVGRGAAESFCLLLHDGQSSAAAAERLRLLRDTEDGFAIADADFKLRGGGDLLGTRQSGQRAFRMADLALDDDLLAMASKDAAVLLANDPDLVSARGQAARCLLKLFDRRAALRTLLSG